MCSSNVNLVSFLEFASSFQSLTNNNQMEGRSEVRRGFQMDFHAYGLSQIWTGMASGFLVSLQPRIVLSYLWVFDDNRVLLILIIVHDHPGLSPAKLRNIMCQSSVDSVPQRDFFEHSRSARAPQVELNTDPIPGLGLFVFW